MIDNIWTLSNYLILSLACPVFATCPHLGRTVFRKSQHSYAIRTNHTSHIPHTKITNVHVPYLANAGQWPWNIQWSSLDLSPRYPILVLPLTLYWWDGTNASTSTCPSTATYPDEQPLAIPSSWFRHVDSSASQSIATPSLALQSVATTSSQSVATPSSCPPLATRVDSDVTLEQHRFGTISL